VVFFILSCAQLFYLQRNPELYMVYRTRIILATR
jgi:hypothetical protein